MLSLADTPPETNAVLGDSEIGWLAAAVIPGKEKDAARRMMACGSRLFFFLPYQAYVTESRNTVYKPLFPGYIFVGQRIPAYVRRKKLHDFIPAMDLPQASSLAFGTKRVSALLAPPSQSQLRETLVRLAETDPLIREIREDFPQKGERVRFKDEHPLRGMEGIADEGYRRVWIRVEVFGRVTPIQVDREMLEPVC